MQTRFIKKNRTKIANLGARALDDKFTKTLSSTIANANEMYHFCLIFL